MPPRAIIFDFDGTLADSFPAITASVNHVRALRGLPPLRVDEVKPHVGRGLPALLQSVVPGADLAEDARRYHEHHPTVLAAGTVLLPGARQVLETLHARGVRTAICSNKPGRFTRDLVRILAIDPWMDAVVGPEDAPRPKPAPDMLREAMARLGVAPHETLYLGDMVVDIETARAAGAPVWVVPTGSEARDVLERAGPDRIIPNLLAVLDSGNSP